MQGDAKNGGGPGAGGNSKNGHNGHNGHGARAQLRNLLKLTPPEIAAKALPSLVRVVTPSGHGTGFVVSADGLLATNLHVIDGDHEATLVFFDGRELTDVRVVAASELCDLVLLKVPASGLVPLELGDSSGVQPGDPVVAVGQPVGLGSSLSDGEVIAIRTLQGDVQVLQISAPLSPSASGGPLMNERGEVIGVATFVVSRGQTLSFGMPVDYLKHMIAAVSSAEAPAALPLAEFAKSRERPGIRRNIPQHDLELLADCSEAELETLREAIWGAINVGAPLYNEGNHEACYRIYEGLALDVERRFPGMAGVKKALLAGVERAAASEGYTQKAWDMRDTFDGLLEVIDRRLGVPEGGGIPGLTRDIPQHDVSLLADCDESTVRAIAAAIASAIEVGAPLYNEGNAEACFLIYQGAALDLTRKLEACSGARQALLDGVNRASALETPEEKAWAMRDTFDGLLDVIERRLAKGAKA